MNNEVSRTVRVFMTAPDEYGNVNPHNNVLVTFSRTNGQLMVEYTLPPVTEHQLRAFNKYFAEELAKYKKGG